jgi:hypothetical protein
MLSGTSEPTISRPRAGGQSEDSVNEQIAVEALGMSAPRVAWICAVPGPLVVTWALPEASTLTGEAPPVITAPAAGLAVPSSPYASTCTGNGVPTGWRTGALRTSSAGGGKFGARYQST